MFQSVTNPNGNVDWTLADYNNSDPASCVLPRFSGCDNSATRVTRAATYLKPGKLLLVGMNIGTGAEIWGFQKILSSSRTGETNIDTASAPRWYLITTSAVSSMADIDTQTSAGKFVAIAFDGLVMVHERGNW